MCPSFISIRFFYIQALCCKFNLKPIILFLAFQISFLPGSTGKLRCKLNRNRPTTFSTIWSPTRRFPHSQFAIWMKRMNTNVSRSNRRLSKAQISRTWNNKEATTSGQSVETEVVTESRNCYSCTLSLIFFRLACLPACCWFAAPLSFFRLSLNPLPVLIVSSSVALFPSPVPLHCCTNSPSKD